MLKREREGRCEVKRAQRGSKGKTGAENIKDDTNKNKKGKNVATKAGKNKKGKKEAMKDEEPEGKSGKKRVGKRKREEDTTIELLSRGLVDGTEKRQNRKRVHAEFNQALQKAKDRVIERTHCAPQSAPIQELQREI
jgi:hypothetical protein